MDDESEAYASNPLHERESTSLWTDRDDASGEMYVASYQAAGRPAIEPYGLATHPSTRSPFIQIQLVKRRNRDGSRPFYEVVIAGMRSQGVASPEGHIAHELCTHAGWELDALTKRAVVSPCAVSVLVEDGERPPDRCEISMFMSRPLTGERREAPLFIANKEIQAFSVRDDVYSPTLTTYPSLFPPPMRVAFFDYGRVYQDEADVNRKQTIPFANTVAPMILGRLLTYMNYDPASGGWFGNIMNSFKEGATNVAIEYLFTTATTTGLAATTLAGGLAITASLMAFPLIGAGLYAVTQSAGDFNKALRDDDAYNVRQNMDLYGIAAAAVIENGGMDIDASVDTLNQFLGFTTSGENDPPGAESTPSDADTPQGSDVSSLNGMLPGFGTAASALASHVWDIVSEAEPGAEEAPSTSSEGGDGYDRETIQKILGASVVSFGRTIESYFNRKPSPDPLRVSFTLEEFASSLNILAATTAQQASVRPTAEETKQFNLKFRRQLILWQWLQDPDANSGLTERVVQSAQDGFSRRANPLDTSECNSSADFAVKTFFEVMVEDGDICADDNSEKHRFECTRTDSEFLGSIANNELMNIDSVKEATFNLIRSIEAAIARTKQTRTTLFSWLNAATEIVPRVLRDFLSTTFNLAYFATVVPFYEQAIAFPILKSILGSRKRLSEKQQAREVTDLLNANEALYRRVLENIPLKLQRHFDSDLLNSSIGKFRLGSRLAMATSRAMCAQPRAQRQPRQPSVPTERKNMTIDEFFESTEAASATVAAFLDSILDSSTREPATRARQAVLRRYLPHAAAGVAYFFPPLTAIESNAIDFVDQFITTREVSKVHDAMVAYNAYAAKASAALRNLVLVWTRNDRAPFQLVHYHTLTPALTSTLSDKRSRTINDSFALQLGPPSDIFEVLSSANTTEGTELRIEAVAPGGSKPYHGIEGTWQHVVAMQFYAEIVSIELLNRHRHHSDWQMATFSTRAHVDGLAFKCASFVLRLCSERQPVLPSPFDPSTFSTETRRYSQLLLSRVHALDLAKRGAVSSLKLVAKALKGIATDRSVDWNSIPVEPLAYLRMSYKHGEDGFRRVVRVLPGDQGRLAPHVRSLCAASYPVLLLNRSAEGRWVEDGTEPHVLSDGHGLHKPGEGDDALVRIRLLRRFESLRINFDDGGAEGIERRLRSVSLKDDDGGNAALGTGRFFVPYGYGDNLPPLSSRSVLPFMFASVPVEISNVVVAIDAITSSLQSTGGDAAARAMEFVPSFTRCRSADIAFVVDNPNELVYDGRHVRFLSSFVGNTSTASDVEADTVTATDAAAAAVVSPFTHSLSDVYSSIAWNAERILQSIVLTACTDAAMFDVRIPSPTGAPFSEPSTQRLEEQRTMLRYELASQARMLRTEVRRVLLRVATVANERLTANLEKSRGFATLGQTNASGLSSRTLSEFAFEEPSPKFATGPWANALSALTPMQLFLGREYIDDDVLSAHADRMFSMAKELFTDLREGRVDSRVLVRNIGSADTIKNWIFRRENVLGLGLFTGPPIVDPEDFKFKVGGDRFDLDDLSIEVKREITNKRLRMTSSDVVNVESPHRLVFSLKSKLDRIDRELADVATQGGSAVNIHSETFREQFLVSLVAGQAMAIGVLGQAATPLMRKLNAAGGGSAGSIGAEETSRLVKRLGDVRKQMSDAQAAVGALRLCDMCAIIHCIIVG